MENPVEFHDERVLRLLRAGQKLPGVALQRLKNKLDDLALHVERRAIKRAPAQRGALRGSAQSDVRAEPGRGLVATVSFGGLASAYAEVQHEREDFTHTREAWVAKYGTFVGARSSLKTGRASFRNKRGGALKLKGHKGGQAKFLYGREDSAWNRSEQRMVQEQLETTLGAEAEKVLHEG